MKPGRKNKPIALRVLEGDPKVSGKGITLIDSKRPTRPDWVTGYAATAWNRLAPMLTKIGILTEFDRDILAVYCSLLAAYRTATEAGSVSKMVRIGQQLRLVGNELGLTPASRAGQGIDASRKPGRLKTGARRLF